MPLRPLHDQVIVRKHQSGRTTTAGIVLPEDQQDTGTVLAVGPGKLLKSGRRKPMEVKVGDTVLFGKYAGAQIKDDVRWRRLAPDELVMPEDHIMGIVER